MCIHGDNKEIYSNVNSKEWKGYNSNQRNAYLSEVNDA